MNLRRKWRRSTPKLLAAVIVAAVLATSACTGSPDQRVIAGNQADGLAGVDRPDPSELSARELVIAAMNAQVGESSRGSATTRIDDVDGPTMEMEIDELGNTRITQFQQLVPEDPDLLSSSEVLVVDGVGYIRFSIPEELLGESGIEIPDGWMTMSRETMELFGFSCGPPVPGSGLGTEECAPPNDLSDMTDFVLEATVAGLETVRGVETHRVVSALDFKSLMESVLDDSPDVGIMDLIVAMMPSALPVELWIDDDLRMHRMTMDLTLNVEALGEELGEEIGEVPTAIVVMDFYDFGADIIIEAPPPDEIVGEVGDWFEQLGILGLFGDPSVDPITAA